MTLRIQIDCYHQYRCECKPIPQTKVSKQEIAYNLIRCNPGLARYLGKTNVVTETTIERNQMKIKQQTRPYQSIVDQKNLNILLSQKYPLNPPFQLKRQQQVQQSPRPDPSVQLLINNYISTQAQTSPLILKPQKRTQIKSPRQKQIKQYFKELKQTSRYLSDTGFRKYFNRQVFQNYGRENTHGTNDGIIYGNYMKTHNINPHTGTNQPHDEETFYHALTAASPQKILSPKNINFNTQENRGRNMFQSRYKQNKQSLQKPLKKHENDTDQIIGDNIRYHQKMETLSKSRSRSKGMKTMSPNVVKTVQNEYRNQNKIPNKSPNNYEKISKGHQTTISPKIQSHYVNTKQTIQPIRPKQQAQIYKEQQLSPRSNLISQRQQINKLSQIKSVDKKCPVDLLKQKHMEHIMSKECKVKPSPSVKQNILY